jgi:hypothetical protein
MAVQAVRIDYPKQWFIIGTVVVASAMATMLFLAYDTIEEFGRAFWLVCALGMGIPLLLLLVPPIFTCHHVGEKSLKLRMGFLMNSTIPFTQIKEIKDHSIRLGAVTVGIGVRYIGGRSTVYVTSSFHNPINIRLHEPEQLGKLLRPKVDTIIMNVKDKEGFMALIRDRIGAESEDD